MYDTQRQNSTSPSVSAELEVEQMLAGLFIVVLASLKQSPVSWAENLERAYLHAQLLAAYRLRHAWRKSDIPRLKSLGVNSSALTRIERLAGRGRPVVRPYQPLDVAIVTKLSAFQSFVDPDVSPDKRRRAFKTWPWWQHYVEALYRGEHALAKDRGTRSASIEAEESVGRTLGISASTVHTICGGIRRMRKADEGSAKFSDHDAG
jgi:hypothetical protein